MERTEVVRKAKDAGVHLVSFFWCDNGGIIRGKSTHISGLETRLSSGIGVTTAMQAMGDMDQLQVVDGMGPAGEFRLIPDLDTFTILPYAPKRALMLSDLIATSRQPWEACPRDFLKRMLAKAETMGLTFQVAMEPEWYLARQEGDGFVPCDESLDNSSVGMTFAQDVVDDVIEALEAQGIGIEQYHTEVGHGQHELSIRHAPALRAADNHLIYRETVRNVAYQHGLFASFAPKPFPDQAGNGCHIHISAWDLDEEENLFFDADDEQSLSELAYYFIGGIMEHLPGLVALTCPSMNSYRRLSPGSWSTAFTCYGPDNREAALRIPSTFWGAEMASTNLEFRPADSSSNPYIALGGLIAAGLDGVARELKPSPEQNVDSDPTLLDPEELVRRGIRRLPSSLLEATRALEEDSVLIETMGPALSGSYLAIRRADWNIFSQQDLEFEIRNHFYKY
jgi:glutamine synthetase